MTKIIRPSTSGGITRRSFGAGALGTSLLLGTGLAPAIAQGKRELRVGVFGGEFGNLSPVIRYDIQGGLVVYNIFDLLLKIDFAKHAMAPMLALEWANPDPLTWRVKLREGVKWHKGYGEFTAVGYFFARELRRHLPGNVPVGIIKATLGGSPIEAWIGRQTLESDPAFAVIAERWKAMAPRGWLLANASAR